MIRKHFRLKQIALGLAFAAVVVPIAQARVIIDGYAAPVSYTAVAHQPIASTIKLTGAALVNAPVPASHITSAGTASSSSVNWSAVGIGASVSFAALLLLLTAVALGRRNRPRDLAGV
jgi:hypothetical protein